MRHNERFPGAPGRLAPLTSSGVTTPTTKSATASADPVRHGALEATLAAQLAIDTESRPSAPLSS